MIKNIEGITNRRYNIDAVIAANMREVVFDWQ